MPKHPLADLTQLAAFAADFLRKYPQGLCVGLTGDLGAGKTTFVRACIELICQKTNQPKPRVVSPSYVIQQSYGKLHPPVEHFDLYRLERLDFQALVDMGYFEALETCRAKHGFVFIEWPERAAEGLLQLQANLHFEVGLESRTVMDSIAR